MLRSLAALAKGALPSSAATDRHQATDGKAASSERMEARAIALPETPLSSKGDRGLRSAIVSRSRGPGGLYNLGNLTALFSGLTVQIVHTRGTAGIGDSIVHYLFGTPGAAWLTASMIVFLASGEAYHRAWASRARPLVRLNRLGDLLSTGGAACLTMALIHFGDVLLALVAGTLLAGGKLGTALLPAGRPLAAGRFRWAVVLSRLPSIAALIGELYRLVASGSSAFDAFLPSVMLVCFVLWLSADILLLRGERSTSAMRALPRRTVTAPNSIAEKFG